MDGCKGCAGHEKKNDPVPFIVHEGAIARVERTSKRFFIAFLVVLFLWFSTIGLFVWYLNQYDFSGESYSVDLSTDGGGDANFIGQDGDIYNGESEGR